MISDRAAPDCKADRRRLVASTAAAAVVAVVLSSCALLAPLSRDEFTLVGISGASLPVTLNQYQLSDGRIYERGILAGRFTRFESGRYALEYTFFNLFDGVPGPDLPAQKVYRGLGRIEQRDTLLLLGWMFEGRMAGESLHVQDISGALGNVRLEFVRAH